MATFDKKSLKANHSEHVRTDIACVCGLHMNSCGWCKDVPDHFIVCIVLICVQVWVSSVEVWVMGQKNVASSIKSGLKD